MNQNLYGSNPGINTSMDERIDFRGLLYSLWEQKFLILAITFIVTAIATAYMILKVPEYEANMLLYVENKNAGNLSNSISQQLNLGPAKTNSTDAQIALIRSKFILDPVINMLDLDITIKPHYFPIIGYLFASKSDGDLKLNHLVLPTLYKKLKLKVIDASHYQLLDKNKMLIQGEVGKLITSKSGIAIQVAEMQAKAAAEFDIVRQSRFSVIKNLKSNLHIQELGDNNSQTGILEISLRDKDPTRLVRILDAISKVTQEKDAERKTLETAKTLDFLNQQLPLVKLSLAEAETALNRYRASSGKLDIKIETQQLIRELAQIEKEITTIKLKKAELLQKFTERHPAIIAVNDKIQQLQKQKLYIGNKIKVIPAADQIAINLMRDAKVKNELYLILLNKIQEMRVVKAGTLSDIRTLTTPILPESPLPKQTPIIIIAAIVLGLILGCLTVFTRKAFFGRVNDPHWVENHLNINNLAIIPYSKQQRKNIDSFKRKASHLQILAQKYPGDLSVEALRSLRTSFQIIGSGAKNNIMTIMGVSPAIGKSFVTVNFSYLLADIGKRVLLIDGDIRKGRLHHYFQLATAPGLSEVAAGKLTLEEGIQKTAFDSLYFLPCGLYPQNPAELLMSSNFKNLMEMASRNFDLVIVDTAPILAVTDSTIIGSLAGINFLVLGSDTHQPEEVTLAVKRLENAGIEIHGSIFNNIKPEVTMYGKSKYNYSYYKDDSATSSVMS